MSPLSLLAIILQGLVLGLTAAASPGPLQTFLVNRTLAEGWRRGAPVAFAPLISDAPVVLLILLTLRQLPEQFLKFVSLAGGLFLLYLSWKLWRTWRANATPDPTAIESPALGSNLGRAVLLNLLSPGLYAFWTLVNGPLLLTALGQSWFHGAAFLLGFYGTFTGSNLALVAIFHQARRLGPQVVRILTLLSILIMFVFGVILVVQSAS